ncbi:MAG: multicopper oxidase domain-containing protein [Flavobacteriales bacterium]|nr:multicopper oxidase domain-containing protein [Flavobacteriales bacterium]
MRLALVIVCILVGVQSMALDIVLHINKGELDFGGSAVSICAFNETETLDSKNAIIELEIDELLNLTVINNDSLTHDFTIDGVILADNDIAGYSQETFQLSFDELGAWRFYSSVSYGEYIGATGIINVGLTEETCFFWNLFDLNKELTYDLASAELEYIPSMYLPELFFINGDHFPNTLEDEDALVSVELGDTCYITIVNGGNMDHVMHFHGFHAEIVSAQVASDRVGWSKDTVPIKKGEAVVLQLVANLEGIYPVHDHNLIAVTNTGFYPGGMITQIHVGQ